MSIARKAIDWLREVPGLRRVVGLGRRVALRALGAGSRLSQVESDIEQIRPATAQMAQFSEHMPALINAVSSFSGTARRLQRNAADTAEQMVRVWALETQRSEAQQATWKTQTEHGKSINQLWERLELVRKELMIEVRYGDGESTEDVELATKVVDDAKFQKARQGELPVNLGCGHIPIEGYLNVDMRELPGVDVISTATDLPFSDDELSEIHSAHLVEHFPQERLVREILPYWKSKIRPGGELTMVLPDSGSMLEGFAKGEIPWDELREVLYGGQEYEGDFHFNMYSAESMSKILTEAGFSAVDIEVEGRRNGACLEMQLTARKPE